MSQSQIITDIAYSEHGVNYKKHAHNYYEMIVVLKGVCRIEFKNKTVDVGADSLVFINCFEEHSTVVLQEPYVRYYVTMDPRKVDYYIHDARLLSVFKNRPATFENVFDIAGISGRIAHIMSMLIQEQRNYEDEYKSEYIVLLLRMLLINIYRNNYAQIPHKSNDKSLVYEIQSYIDQHFREPLLISDIARDNFISPHYLSHCFRDQTGYSPKQYLMLNRLIYAKELLLSSDLTVTEIAARAGFSDTNNFIKHFKKHYNSTPRSLRKASELGDAQSGVYSRG